jgi:hypothetical protein
MQKNAGETQQHQIRSYGAPIFEESASERRQQSER